MKIRPKKLRLKKIKIHSARGHGPTRGWLIKVFVEFQDKIKLVVKQRGRSLVLVPYGTMSAAESTSVVSVRYKLWKFGAFL